MTNTSSFIANVLLIVIVNMMGLNKNDCLLMFKITYKEKKLAPTFLNEKNY